MSHCILLLEDQASLEGENKSLELATHCFANGHPTLLFDGRQVVEISASDPPSNVQLIRWDSDQSGYIDVAVLVDWFGRNYSDLMYLILIVDLKFGDDDAYGEHVFAQLCRSTDFKGSVEPIVYSRWANDNRREDLMQTFSLTDGSRVLNRDLDEYEEVFAAIRAIVREYSRETD